MLALKIIEQSSKSWPPSLQNIELLISITSFVQGNRSISHTWTHGEIFSFFFETYGVISVRINLLY